MNIKKAPTHIPSEDGSYRMEDYTFEYCPSCESDVVIYANGVTACPNCGEPLAPCSVCETCDYSTCPYGCTDCGTHIDAEITNPPISKEEQGWYSIMSILLASGKGA